MNAHSGIRGIALVLVVLLGSVPVRAQTTVTLDGTVRDAATSRPIIGASVTLTTAGVVRTARTDETGAFRFANALTGTSSLSVRSIGYEPSLRSLQADGSAPILVRLNRIAALDTVRVRAAPRAIYGVVATAHDMKPVRNATVQVFGTSVGQATADSTGHFYHALKSAGAYMVRAKSEGRASQTLSLNVGDNDGVEVALLLDSVPAPGANALEAAYANLRDRLPQRGLMSVVASRGELAARGDGELMSSLLLVMTAMGLRLSNEACLFVDGTPRPGLWLNDIEISDIDMLEAYSITSDRSGTLAARWPKLAPCGFTNMPRALPSMSGQRSSEIVKWVVVWMKR